MIARSNRNITGETATKTHLCEVQNLAPKPNQIKLKAQKQPYVNPIEPGV